MMYAIKRLLWETPLSPRHHHSPPAPSHPSLMCDSSFAHTVPSAALERLTALSYVHQTSNPLRSDKVAFIVAQYRFDKEIIHLAKKCLTPLLQQGYF